MGEGIKNWSDGVVEYWRNEEAEGNLLPDIERSRIEIRVTQDFSSDHTGKNGMMEWWNDGNGYFNMNPGHDRLPKRSSEHGTNAGKGGGR
jgi:hypothetical protein